jgi:AcrR family transcriptional regulator
VPSPTPRTDPPIRSIPNTSAASSGTGRRNNELQRVDPRVRRTRATLQGALIDLVQARRWDKITVQQLLDCTGVSRSTFYAHYDNKLDVLTAAIDDLADGVFVGLPGGPPDLLPLFEHVDEMRNLFRALLHQPVLGEIVDLFHRALADAWKRYLGSSRSPSTMLPELLAGATVAVLRSYAAAPPRQRSAAAASAELSGLLQPLLDARR